MRVSFICSSAASLVPPLEVIIIPPNPPHKKRKAALWQTQSDQVFPFRPRPHLLFNTFSQHHPQSVEFSFFFLTLVVFLLSCSRVSVSTLSHFLSPAEFWQQTNKPLIVLVRTCVPAQTHTNTHTYSWGRGSFGEFFGNWYSNLPQLARLLFRALIYGSLSRRPTLFGSRSSFIASKQFHFIILYLLSISRHIHIVSWSGAVNFCCRKKGCSVSLLELYVCVFFFFMKMCDTNSLIVQFSSDFMI